MISDNQKRMLNEMQQAISFFEQGNMIEAKEKCEYILSHNPHHPDALHLSGIIVGQIGQLSLGIQLIQKAISLYDQDSSYHSNLAIFLARIGELNKAIQQYKIALSLKPDDPGILNNLGMALYYQKNIRQSLPYFIRALEIKPEYYEARIHLSMAYEALNQIDSAIKCCQYVISQSINRHQVAMAYNQLGNLWLKKAFVPEAIESYKNALNNDNTEHQIWSNYLLTLNYDSDQTPRNIFSAHKEWGEWMSSAIFPVSFHNNMPDMERPIRIGYLSPDFRMHPVSFFIEPLLKHHDNRIIEVYCYSDVQKTDLVTSRLKQYSHIWKNISGHSNDYVSELIQSDGIDILIDLSGHTAKNRLCVFARKPAPIQLSYLGYANTTGLKTMDYRLTDSYSNPENSDHLYSEKLIRIDPCFCCYQPPDIRIEISALPALSNKRITFGAFHNLSKVSQDTLQLWTQLLHVIPDSQLILQSISLSDVKTVYRFQQWFEANEIELNRVEFLGYQSFDTYLKNHHKIDILLDTQPWSGHTIACHGLWMGIPIITLEGAQYAGRMVGSILKTLGMQNWIANTQTDYLKKAIYWSNNREQLAELRTSIRLKLLNSPVCDAVSFTKKIEMTFRQLWMKWCQEIKSSGR